MTIHRKVNQHDAGEPRKGYEMDQTLCLRDANFKVHWTLDGGDAPPPGHVGGRGPGGLYARTELPPRPEGDGGRTSSTRTSSSAPGGLLGAAASRVVVGGVPSARRDASLQQLKALLEH